MNTACPVCDDPAPVLAWTDTHGIAQCRCGAPFRLYHYEGDKPVNKQPECCVRGAWIPLLRRYRADTGRVIPGGYSFPGGQERASAADFDAFNAWCDAHRPELPAPLEKPA